MEVLSHMRILKYKRRYTRAPKPNFIYEWKINQPISFSYRVNRKKKDERVWYFWRCHRSQQRLLQVDVNKGVRIWCIIIYIEADVTLFTSHWQRRMARGRCNVDNGYYARRRSLSITRSKMYFIIRALCKCVIIIKSNEPQDRLLSASYARCTIKDSDRCVYTGQCVATEHHRLCRFPFCFEINFQIWYHLQIYMIYMINSINDAAVLLVSNINAE